MADKKIPSNVPDLTEEMRMLLGIKPRYLFSEAKSVNDQPHDFAQVNSKQYNQEMPPETKPEGGVAGAEGGKLKVARSGGYDGGPGINDLATPAPSADKEGGYRGNTGEHSAKVGGYSAPVVPNKKTAPAPAAKPEGGYRDDGQKTSATQAKAGGASGADANRDAGDDLPAEEPDTEAAHLEAMGEVSDRTLEAREFRIGRMKDILSMFEEQDEESVEA